MKSDNASAPFDVSVVIPVFNRARSIRRAVDSALRQSHPVFEVIVVDDGSTDESANIVAMIDDERVRLVRQVNAGAGAARNAGMALARGSWIAFLDSDDEWGNDRIASARRLVEANPRMDFLHSARRYVNAEGSEESGLSDTPFDLADRVRLLSGFKIKTSAVILRRSIVDTYELLFPIKRKTCEDYDLFWRAIMVSREVGYSPEAEVTVHLGSDGLSRAANDETARARDDVETLVSVRQWASARRVDDRLSAVVSDHFHWTVCAAIGAALRRADLKGLAHFLRISIREEGWLVACRNLASACFDATSSRDRPFSTR